MFLRLLFLLVLLQSCLSLQLLWLLLLLLLPVLSLRLMFVLTLLFLCTCGSINNGNLCSLGHSRDAVRNAPNLHLGG